MQVTFSVSMGKKKKPCTFSAINNSATVKGNACKFLGN